MTLKQLLRRMRYRLFAYAVQRNRRDLAHPYHIRWATSDGKIERDVFREEEIYVDGDFPTDPRWIIDAGANIGLRCIWFANRFPEATIVAVEPERGNFELLRKNTSFYPNIHCVRAGLWKTDSLLRIANPTDAYWAFTVEELPPDMETASDFRGITIESLMRDFGMKTVDILKIDIEGSEKEVFEHAEAWIDDVDCFLIEFHDRFKECCTQTFLDAMSRFEYSFDEKKDGNVLVRRKR